MIQHFIISPFSYRRPGFNKNKWPDPLNVHILEHRLKLFEIVTLASLKAQIRKDFSWVIIVDPKLPDKFRNRMHNLIKEIRNTRLHDYSPEIDENNLNWLKTYISPQTNYITTTILGCDDGLFRGFTKYIHENINALHKKNENFPMMVFACKNVVQWDFFYTENAPLGYQKPWTRKKTLTVGTGLTLCCKYPELDYSINGFGHHLIDYLFMDDSSLRKLDAEIYDEVKTKQEEVRKRVQQSSLNWDGVLNFDDSFHVISTNYPQALVLNHFGNVRYKRLFEAPDLRIAVTAKNSFPEIAIDFALATKYIQSFQRTIPLFLRFLKNSFKYNPANKPGMCFKERFNNKMKRLRSFTKGFRNLK